MHRLILYQRLFARAGGSHVADPHRGARIAPVSCWNCSTIEFAGCLIEDWKQFIGFIGQGLQDNKKNYFRVQ